MGPKAPPVIPPAEEAVPNLEQPEPEPEPSIPACRICEAGPPGIEAGTYCKGCGIEVHLEYSELPELFKQYTLFIDEENAARRAKKVAKELPTLPEWAKNDRHAKEVRMINKRLDEDAVGCLGGKGWKLYMALFDAFKRNTSITSVYLVGNGLGDDGVIYFADSLKRVSGAGMPIDQLRLCANGMKAEGTKELAKALAAMPTLRVLELAENGMGDEGMRPLSLMVERTPSIAQFSLRANAIGNRGVALLAPALGSHPKLHTLDLRENAIGGAGAEALSNALATHPTLVTLLLASNQLGDAGVTAIGHLLRTNSRLEKVDVRCNGIGKAGAEALLESILHNVTVGDVQIGGNPQVEVEHVQRLTVMLSVEQRLKRQVEIEKTRSQQEKTAALAATRSSLKASLSSKANKTLGTSVRREERLIRN